MSWSGCVIAIAGDLTSTVSGRLRLAASGVEDDDGADGVDDDDDDGAAIVLTMSSIDDDDAAAGRTIVMSRSRARQVEQHRCRLSVPTSILLTSMDADDR